jgi:hypothetical protein
MVKEELALCGRCLATEIIPRAAKRAEIVSRPAPSAAKTEQWARACTHQLPGILDRPGTAGCHWQPEHGHKSNGDFTLLRLDY